MAEDTKQLNNERPNRSGGEHRHSRRPPREKSEYDSRTLDLARVTRVTKGGKRFSFRASVVVGDGKGKVGVGIAQGADVAQAIQKATNQARRFMLVVPITNESIPHVVQSKYSSAVVLLKPASKGSGLKAGGPVRAVVSLAGIQNLTSKLLTRTKNKINIARATMKALGKLKVQGEKFKA